MTSEMIIVTSEMQRNLPNVHFMSTIVRGTDLYAKVNRSKEAEFFDIDLLDNCYDTAAGFLLDRTGGLPNNALEQFQHRMIAFYQGYNEDNPFNALQIQRTPRQAASALEQLKSILKTRFSCELPKGSNQALNKLGSLAVGYRSQYPNVLQKRPTSIN